MTFDVPNHPGTYEERYSLMTQNIHEKHHKYSQIAPKEECKDIQHLQQFLQEIIEQGGEGIILRNPSSLYEKGKSRSFLKLKV